MKPGWPVLLCVVLLALLVGLALRSNEGRIRRRRGADAANGVDETGGSVFDQLPPEIAEALRGQLTERAGTGTDGTSAPESHTGPNAITLLQLSTAFCAPCRHTRILLSTLVANTPGLRHVEVDLTHHPQWSTPLGVHSTPTTLALDTSGREVFRISGVPKRDKLAEELRPYLPS